MTYWLARVVEGMYPQFVDGPHDHPEGVLVAKGLMIKIFGDEGPWKMVTLTDVPSGEPEGINEEAAEECRTLMESKR